MKHRAPLYALPPLPRRAPSWLALAKLALLCVGLVGLAATLSVLLAGLLGGWWG